MIKILYLLQTVYLNQVKICDPDFVIMVAGGNYDNRVFCKYSTTQKQHILYHKTHSSIHLKQDSAQYVHQ